MYLLCENTQSWNKNIYILRYCLFKFTLTVKQSMYWLNLKQKFPEWMWEQTSKLIISRKKMTVIDWFDQFNMIRTWTQMSHEQYDHFSQMASLTSMSENFLYIPGISNRMMKSPTRNDEITNSKRWNHQFEDPKQSTMSKIFLKLFSSFFPPVWKYVISDVPFKTGRSKILRNFYIRRWEPEDRNIRRQEEEK